jgi:hypothetical protein
MAKKTPGFIPTPGGSYCPKNVGSGIPQNKDASPLERTTMKIVRESFKPPKRRK